MHYSYGIYGAAGGGQNLLHAAQTQLQRQGLRQYPCFIDDEVGDNTQVLGRQSMPYADFMKGDPAYRKVVVAIANPATRKKLMEKVLSDGGKLWSVVDKSAVIDPTAQLGKGATLYAHTVIGSGCVVGKGFRAAAGSILCHDCIVADYVTLCANVTCNGYITIEEGVYIGSNAVIINGSAMKPIRIGKGAVIGMGAVVLGDVEPYTTVVGNPAKPINK